jgi:hypothetical protein
LKKDIKELNKLLESAESLGVPSESIKLKISEKESEINAYL